jgi:flagella basal body P-ring formation protein FlgA
MTIKAKQILLILVWGSFITLCYSLQAHAANTAPQVATVKMTVQRGDIVNLNNLELVDYNRKKVPNGVIDNINDAAGLEALRTLRPGMTLRYSYLREKPMVRKNKAVKVKYNVPGILLESQGQALQDGQKGDLIKVKNIKSNKTITAEVIADNTVEVK